MLVSARRLFATGIFVGVLLSLSRAPAQPNPEPSDPPQVKDAMQSAAKLMRAKKFDEARKAYQAIAADHPKSDIAARARLGVVNTYREKGDFPAAIPLLEQVLAADENASLASVQQAKALLVEARSRVASSLVKANEIDGAIAELRKTLTDARSTPAGVRAAMVEIATRQANANRTKEAIATYRELLKMAPVGDRERVLDLGALTRLDPSAVGDLGKFIKDHPAAPREYLALARDFEGDAFVRLKKPDDAAASFAAALAYANVPFEEVRLALIGKADVMLLKNDREGAVAVYRELLRRPTEAAAILPGRRPYEMRYPDGERLVDLNRLVDIAAPNADVTADVASYLSQVAQVILVTLGNRAPKNDVFPAIQSSLPHQILAPGQKPPRFDGTRRFAEYLKETPAGGPKVTLEDVDEQLARGGALRPFVTSDFSKKVAAAISADAPMADYLRPLLAGDYQTAARAAWRRARLARNASNRENWIAGVELAVSCADQSRATRAEPFYNWANPDSAEAKAKGAAAPDDLRSYLGPPELPFESNKAALASAAAELNRRGNPMSLYPVLETVLPDNDAAIFGTDPGQAKRSYEIYLWRTTGRATAAELDDFSDRLAHAGPNKLFIVSPQSKQLAGMISRAAPMGDYFKLLFGGEHRAAARLAWQYARHVETVGPLQRYYWAEAVALAARCHDQDRGGRAEKFIKWFVSNPDGGEPAEPNPLADFLKE